MIKTEAEQTCARPLPMRIALPAYTPYGHSHTQANLAPMLGFNGEPYEWLSRTYVLGQGYRSYSPALMRFLSPDSLSPFGEGGLGAYAFCGADPINYLDATGHAPMPVRARIKSGPKAVIRSPANHREQSLFKTVRSSTAETDTKVGIPIQEARPHQAVNAAKVPAHQDFQKRKDLIDRMAYLYEEYEYYQKSLATLWAPATRERVKELKTLPEYRKAIEVTNGALTTIWQESLNIDSQLKNIRLTGQPQNKYNPH
ncbi:RHS repeat-associated core domain-containing protein [Pseudomonas sp. WOUb67]|uniref:RHS repeat-associated core domain-containing protein n=1 Tax=Pseudomonas sp. WOUb67 TaxID=3161136 RepID=UPI003CE77C0C